MRSASSTPIARSWASWRGPAARWRAGSPGAPRIGRRMTHELDCLRGIGAAKIAAAEDGSSVEPATRFYEETREAPAAGEPPGASAAPTSRGGA